MKLRGDIEIDGAYFGGHVRPSNKIEGRVDRRLAENQTGKRRVVIVARARKGRTLTFVGHSEAEGVRFLNSVAPILGRGFMRMRRAIGTCCTPTIR